MCRRAALCAIFILVTLTGMLSHCKKKLSHVYMFLYVSSCVPLEVTNKIIKIHVKYYVIVICFDDRV